MKTRIIAFFAASMAAFSLHASTLTINGVDYTQGGDGWSFDGTNVTLASSGPFVLSTDGETFTNNVGII